MCYVAIDGLSKRKLALYLIAYTKIYSNWIKDLSVKNETKDKVKE